MNDQRQQIRAHIERHLGAIGHTFREPVADSLSVDIHQVAATVERPVHTLITAGMSDLPMQTGGQGDAPRHLELMMTLPRNWSFDDLPNSQGTGYWPVRLLTMLARYPHLQKTALGWGQIVPNGNPAAPYTPGTAFCGVIIAPSLLVPTEFYELTVGSRRIEFHSAIPLYREEMALRQEKGMEFLLSTLIDRGHNDLVDPKRKNVAKKFLGLF